MLIPFEGINPKLHESVFVAETACIIGDVEIGENSSVWYNAVIRGDVNYIRIGEMTNIQDMSMLHVTKETHPLLIGSGVTIGHSVTLHGCTIADACLIGMGTVILDGAVIGKESIVAAGAVVTEEMRIEPRSLVMGFPAKIKRGVTEKELQWIKQSAKNYISYVKRYRESAKI
ncbi:MAG TPA: gamma carbonic anhydrase family protein [bacterium]